MSSGGAFDEDALAGLGRGSKVWVSASGGPPGVTRADAENNKMADARRDVEAYLPATIVRIGDQTCEVKVDDEVQVTEVSRASVFPANPEMQAKARDLTSLSYLNEPSILRCVRDRYAANEVYTDAGPVLVAVNPFKDVSETLYGDAVIEKYKRSNSLSSSEDRTDPHVYKVVANAHRDMLAHKKNQAIVVSGESGAGKTETTKIALRCLAKLGGGVAGSETSTSEGTQKESLFDSVESVLLAANPALEAFGNAKTKRNDNSSRFGKLVEVGFDSCGRVRGARVQTYLLEKTRVVRHAPGERAYHAFYQLVAGASKEERGTMARRRRRRAVYLPQRVRTKERTEELFRALSLSRPRRQGERSERLPIARHYRRRSEDEAHEEIFKRRRRRVRGDETFFARDRRDGKRDFRRFPNGVRDFVARERFVRGRLRGRRGRRRARLFRRRARGAQDLRQAPRGTTGRAGEGAHHARFRRGRRIGHEAAGRV
jgi:hypothetical protein